MSRRTRGRAGAVGAHGAATPAIAACVAAGVDHLVHHLGHGDTDHFGEEAAGILAERGIVPDRVLKTLVVDCLL